MGESLNRYADSPEKEQQVAQIAPTSNLRNEAIPGKGVNGERGKFAKRTHALGAPVQCSEFKVQSSALQSTAS
jgi:hypothetical protein